jgi:hypothetical protein
MKFLLLDDPYVRKLLKIQRTKHIKHDIDATTPPTKEEEEKSDSSNDEVINIEETLARVEKDKQNLPELYQKGRYNMKASILARLVNGINDRYSLNKDISQGHN